MSQKGKSDRQQDSLKSVRIHPELYRQLAHEAIDNDQSIQERVHAILCAALDREDLLAELASRG